MQKTASDHQADYPEAASAVVHKFYMDDYVDSFQNRDDALKLGRDLVSLRKLGVFHLTKFRVSFEKIMFSVLSGITQKIPKSLVKWLIVH